MTWDEYYDGFYGWSERRQIANISKLEDFGESDEVAEIALGFCDEKNATKFIKKALTFGVKFTTDEILDLSICVSDKIFSELVKANSNPYTHETLDALRGLADYKTIKYLAKKDKVKNYSVKGDKKVSFSIWSVFGAVFSILFGVFGIFGAIIGAFCNPVGSSGKKCNGDCRNCPPHYGYRYGRWYYGHDHVHGCEFGGNRCGGGRD